MRNGILTKYNNRFNLFTGLFKEKLVNTGILKDAFDIHSHILSSVDDGVKSMEDALSALDTYKDLGFSHVVCTPHIMTDLPLNKPKYLISQFEKLKKEAEGRGITLQLAAEYMLDSNFVDHLNAGPLLSYDGRHVLVETSYLSASPMMLNQIYELRVAGYVPILAHPERYLYMSEQDYIRLKNGGMLFQLNLLSLLGAYGSRARKKAEYLLKNGFYNFVGTDTHRWKWLKRCTNRLELKKSMLAALVPLFRNNESLVRGEWVDF